jgi:ribonuclease HI
MSDEVYIVVEDSAGEMATLRRAFHNEDDANAYVEDPQQLGNLFVVPLAVDSSYDARPDSSGSGGEAEQTEATIHFDGGARPNPGPAAVGCVVEIGDTERQSSHTIGEATNNQAEYQALIQALKIAEHEDADSVTAKGDSQLIINQITGEWDTNDDTLEDLRDDVRELAQMFDRFNVEHVPREENETADSLVDEAFEEGE